MKINLYRQPQAEDDNANKAYFRSMLREVWYKTFYASLPGFAASNHGDPVMSAIAAADKMVEQIRPGTKIIIEANEP